MNQAYGATLINFEGGNKDIEYLLVYQMGMHYPAFWQLLYSPW